MGFVGVYTVSKFTINVLQMETHQRRISKGRFKVSNKEKEEKNTDFFPCQGG